MDQAAADPDKKRQRRAENDSLAASWWIHSSTTRSVRYIPGDHVYVRPKSRKESGRRGVVVRWDENNPEKRVVIQSDQDQKERSVSVKRLIPIYNKQHSSSSSSSLCVVVTDETILYRQLAKALVIPKQECVLEIGTSTGETSKLLQEQALSWVGFDTNASQSQPPLNTSHWLYQIDALKEPQTAQQYALAHNTSPTMAFVDIGGNRNVESVLQMLSWLLQPPILHNHENTTSQLFLANDLTSNTRAFSKLTTIVIKSRHLVQELHKEPFLVKKDGRRPCLLKGVEEWCRQQLLQQQTFLTRHHRHPLQAPKVLSPKDETTPICRYHNYHKDGCRKDECPYDHDHCHYCRQLGHVAKHCQQLDTT